jgi:serine/threonine protein kinase
MVSATALAAVQLCKRWTMLDSDMLAHKQEGLPPVGSTIGGKFEIIRLLGMGGMGAVFEARHLVTGKSLALKWLKAQTAEEQQGVARFVREAQAAGRVRHPHVVDVYDVGQHGDGHFLVMELLRGESLSDLLERRRLNLDEAVTLLVPAIQGVGAAHRQGVVHRDLKPDNIFLCHNEDGSIWGPKVLDFGISKVADTSSPSLTQSGTTLGTPHYMSPEQIRGLSDTDYRTDIYALGVILYEALAGHVPFDGESYGAIAIEIATASPTPLLHLRSDLPGTAGDIVAKAMARSPSERFQSADELASALLSLASHPGQRVSGTAPALGTAPRHVADVPQAESGPRPVQPAPPRSRKWLWIGVAGALAVLSALAVGFALTQDEPTAATPVATPAEPAQALRSPPAVDVPAPAAAVPVAEAPPEPVAEEGATEAPHEPAAAPVASDAEARGRPRTATSRRPPEPGMQAASAAGRTGMLSRDDF